MTGAGATVRAATTQRVKRLGSVRSAAAVNRLSRTDYLVIETIIHGRADQIAAAVIVSTRADEPFFRGVEPERMPSHTGVA